MSTGTTGIPGPVVIGGVGGSGTRLAAHLLRELGFYLGDELNPALDNLWFTLLFRRPDWRCAKPAQVPIALRLFERAMDGGLVLEPWERAILRVAMREIGDWVFQDKGAPFRWARSMRASAGPPPAAAGWGWKNPITHLYMEELAHAFPAMKYIHVVRNGLELVDRPKTRAQVHAWGPALEIESLSAMGVPWQCVELNYWIRANRRALELGPRLFGDRFLVIRYESVCESPRDAVALVSEFAGVKGDPELSYRFSDFVVPQPSRRDPQQEARWLRSKDLAEVEALGF
jgi:hypothetical protein